MLPNITPTDEQNRAIQAIKEWYQEGSKPYFYLAGYAGSGKTSIAKFAVDACGIDPDNMDDVCYGTYTGKAAMVMRRKGMMASTVHGLIYRLIDDSEGNLVFELNTESHVKKKKIIVLDECSMIDDDMAKDLLWFNVKVLVLGDPAQITPVSGKEGFFTRGEPDFFLKEIHRQALENPIIWHAHQVRKNLEPKFVDDGAFKKIRLEDADDSEIFGANQILTGKNITRRDINKFMLDYHGYELDVPLRSGIKLICLKNKADQGLFNGLICYTQTDDARYLPASRYFYQDLTIEDEDVHLANIRIFAGTFEYYTREQTDYEKENDWRIKRDSLEFDFGYAITVHKSQGSQWDHVMLWDDGFADWKRTERCQWMYTAMTRASEKMTIIV